MATVEKTGNNTVKLTITVDKDTFQKAMQESYVKTAKQYAVPGFRKGKAPRKVIEGMYGEGVFYEEAFDIVYGEAYDKAIDENSLIPVDRPNISIDEIGSETGVVFTAEVTLKPEVTLGDYKGIEVVKKEYTVEDDAIDAAIEKEREKAARYVDLDRAVENGDQVVLDYSGSVDGVKFDGGTAENQTLVIGSGSFIPGFEEQLIGVNKGETKDITVTFPEEYHAEHLAGKDAVFTCTVHSNQVKELPELDDEFAKDISEFDTLNELRESKRAEMQKQRDERASNEMENAALLLAAKNATIDIPAVMCERQMDYTMQEMQYRLSMSGISLEDYCKFSGSDVATMREGFRKEAEERVRLQLVMEAISKAEDMQASDEDVEKEIGEYAEKNNLTVADFRSGLSDEDLEYFKSRVITEKTVRLIMDNVVYVEAKEEEKADGETEAE